MFMAFIMIGGCAPSKQITVFTIGDSTMASKKAEVYPETGWGQVFQNYLNSKVRVSNHAVNGRSSKSFIDEGRWNIVLDSLKRGDFVFIQFGHNDEKADKPAVYNDSQTSYRQNLGKYITETRAKGATPVLLTPIVRRKFDAAGKLIDTHGKYPDAVLEVASNLNVELIDMQKLTHVSSVRLEMNLPKKCIFGRHLIQNSRKEGKTIPICQLKVPKHLQESLPKK